MVFIQLSGLWDKLGYVELIVDCTRPETAEVF